MVRNPTAHTRIYNLYMSSYNLLKPDQNRRKYSFKNVFDFSKARKILLFVIYFNPSNKVVVYILESAE